MLMTMSQGICRGGARCGFGVVLNPAWPRRWVHKVHYIWGWTPREVARSPQVMVTVEPSLATASSRRLSG
jgi:hypothetical protein